MPTFKKISGKWQECQALVKEGGTWKEIGAVTAKANGKWADIAPPKPAGRTWTGKDFTYELSQGFLKRIWFTMKAELPQYFTIGDVFDFNPADTYPGTATFDDFGDTVVPGLYIENGKIVGVISDSYPPGHGAFVITTTIDGKAMPGFIMTSNRQRPEIKPAP